MKNVAEEGMIALIKEFSKMTDTIKSGKQVLFQPVKEFVPSPSWPGWDERGFNPWREDESFDDEGWNFLKCGWDPHTETREKFREEIFRPAFNELAK